MHRHLFKGRVKFIAINVDASPESARETALGRWSDDRLIHLWMKESSALLCGLQFVPHRVILRADGSVSRRWDGSHGNVVDGRHGRSRRNGSSKLADMIAIALDEADGKDIREEK